ncbi:Tyrosine-protein phosphatase non-receptor type 12 [Geodia barretti]|nr:Tyrosine-protein phosphatase non-receptor type 12 [Geodia barretti]
MACKLVEMAKPKCERYWPPLNKTVSFGPITVTTIHEEEIGKEFIIRDFVAECGGEKQQIRQYHYSSWPDHGRPAEPQPVLRMINMMHDYRKRLDVPLLVHCSAGCGRTGTIIAIDIARSMIIQRHIPESLSPHDIVESMRKQRPAMVQAKEQYIFVFMAVAELSKKALRQASEGKDGDYENCTPSTTPLADPRDTSSSKTPLTESSQDGGEREGEKQPVAPPRTNQPYENVSVLPRKNGSDRKQSPPQPKPRNSRESAENSPPRPIPPPKQPKIADEPEESHYSAVDMSQLRDKGPEIAVVNEEGLRAPLSKVEEKLDKHGGAAVSPGRSILDTIMSEVGDILPDEKEEFSPPPPPLPASNPPSSAPKWSQFEDEIPPPVPLHTEASTHILEATPTSSDSEHVVLDTGIYYTPTPHSIPMPSESSSSSPVRITPSSPPHVPAPAPPTITTSSTPSSSSTATLPVSSSNSTGKGSRLKTVFKIGKSKSEKRKPLTSGDIGRPTGIPRSPSDHGASSPSRGSSPSPEHGVPSLPQVNKALLSDLGPAESGPANNRYTFPGEMGFGLRIPKPRGPRPEPPHWNMIRNSITAI